MNGLGVTRGFSFVRRINSGDDRFGHGGPHPNGVSDSDGSPCDCSGVPADVAGLGHKLNRKTQASVSARAVKRSLLVE